MVRQSVPDPPEVQALLWAGYDPAAVGFDVGANCGQSIPSMLQLCQQVIAFEPNPDSFHQMAMAWAGHERVRLCHRAVSSVSGFVRLAQLGGEQQETGQLVTPGTTGMEWDPGDWSRVHTADYPSSTLDELALEFGVPQLVKVDTEGHEVQVLTGAQELVAKHLPEWLVEFHSPANRERCMHLLETMSAGAYHLQVIHHPHYPRNSRMWRQHGWIKAVRRVGAAGTASKGASNESHSSG